MAAQKRDPRVAKLTKLKEQQAAREEVIRTTTEAMWKNFNDHQKEIDNIENQLAFERAEERWGPSE